MLRSWCIIAAFSRFVDEGGWNDRWVGMTRHWVRWQLWESQASWVEMRLGMGVVGSCRGRRKILLRRGIEGRTGVRRCFLGLFLPVIQPRFLVLLCYLSKL